jgi:N utilization substance protein B
MGKRSTGRRLAMQALYQAEISGLSIPDAVDNISEDENITPDAIEFAKKLGQAAWDVREKNDKTISNLAIDWPLDRISRVDRSILWLALTELDLKESPTSVVINEALEIAKKYSSSEAAKFINGILGAYLRK